MSSIDSTLQERGSRYGAFTGHAEITQSLKATMHATPNWGKLAPDQKEALDMVAHKVGRILNGDADYIDSWHDIIGYTRLVEQRLVASEKKKPLVQTSVQMKENEDKIIDSLKALFPQRRHYGCPP